MAKKKNTKKNNNSVDWIDEVFRMTDETMFDNEKLTQNFREVVKEDAGMVDDASALKTIKTLLDNAPEEFSCRDRYDFTTARMYLRRRVTKKYLEAARKRYGSRFRNAEEFTAEWGKINTSLCVGGYDCLNRGNGITLSAAIWILDRITIQGKMDEFHKILCEFLKSIFRRNLP